MISAHIGLTYKCNMKCEHCYVKTLERNFNKPDEDLLLERLEELGTFFITYTLGENLLYDNFYEFAQKARKKGFYQILLTNGVLVNSQSVVEKLVKSGIRKVGVSIDSSNIEVHNRNRNFEGAFEKAIQAIDFLSKFDEIETQINMTINSNNISEMFDVIELGRKHGVNSFSFLWQRNNGVLDKIDNREVYENEMKKLFLMKEKYPKLAIQIHDSNSNEILAQLFQDKLISKEVYEDFMNMNVCHALYELIMIEPSGSVHRCNFESKIIANIYEDNFFEKLSSQTCDMYMCRKGL